ncbi:hypothetical protein AB3R30_08390 [Leptolyngbyaceae cyanobacterium UHCC 1019]
MQVEEALATVEQMSDRLWHNILASLVSMLTNWATSANLRH